MYTYACTTPSILFVGGFIKFCTGQGFSRKIRPTSRQLMAGSLCHRIISINGIDYVKYTCLHQMRIANTCAISGLRSDVKYHYNTRSTQKSPVWQQSAWFDTKSPVWHKNARFDTKIPSPACTSGHYHYQTSPRPFCENVFFFQFYSNILFLRTNRKMKMKLYWYEFKTSIFNIIMKIAM